MSESQTWHIIGNAKGLIPTHKAILVTGARKTSQGRSTSWVAGTFHQAYMSDLMPGMKYRRNNFGKAFNVDDERPVFDSSIGYLVLLDNLSKFANGYSISGDYEEYFQCLESLFIELYPIITKDSKELSSELTTARKKAQAAISQIRTTTYPEGSSLEDMKKYHIILNCMMHKNKLRLRTTNDLPGVINQNG